MTSSAFHIPAPRPPVFVHSKVFSFRYRQRYTCYLPDKFYCLFVLFVKSLVQLHISVFHIVILWQLFVQAIWFWTTIGYNIRRLLSSCNIYFVAFLVYDSPISNSSVPNSIIFLLKVNFFLSFLTFIDYICSSGNFSVRWSLASVFDLVIFFFYCFNFPFNCRNVTILQGLGWRLWVLHRPRPRSWWQRWSGICPQRKVSSLHIFVLFCIALHLNMFSIFCFLDL